MRIASGLILVLAVATPLAAEPPAKLDAKTVQAKLKGEWREFDVRVPRDKQLCESFGIQWSMFQPADRTAPPNQTSLTDHDNESTQTHGVLILNTDPDPMWLDFRFPDEAGEMVWVGIVRFDGNQPRWVRSKEWTGLDVYERAKGKVPERPTKFEDAQQQPTGYRLEPFTFRGE